VIAVSKFFATRQEHPHMDEGCMEQAVWFGICPVLNTAAAAEVI